MENCGFNSFRLHRPPPPFSLFPPSPRFANRVVVLLQELENIKKGGAIEPRAVRNPTWPIAKLQ